MPETSYRSRSARIFISYSRKDSSDFVKRLAGDLRYILHDNDAVWYDTLITADKEWLTEITRQLASRKVFILIASPNAFRSSYVKDEIQQAWIGKNQQTSAKKTFIVLHFRECMDQIPKELEFLHIRQWIQCFPPTTHRSVLNELFKGINISLDTRANEFLRTLDALNLADLVRPKASADFSEEERKEYLNAQGKYVYVCIQQNRWEDVENCADEALLVAPNDPNWQAIKQKAKEEHRLTHPGYQKIDVSSNEVRNWRNSTSEGIFRQVPPTATKTSQSKDQGAEQTFHRTLSHNPSQSSTENASRYKSSKETSNLENTSTINPGDFSQPVILTGKTYTPSQIRKSIQDYIQNFTEFIPRLVHN